MKTGLLKQGLTLTFSSASYGELQSGVEKGCTITSYSASSEMIGNIDLAYDGLGVLPVSVVVEFTIRKDKFKLVNLWSSEAVGGDSIHSSGQEQHVDQGGNH
jgi:hypothetical protein